MSTGVYLQVYSSKPSDDEIPKNQLEDRVFAHLQAENGSVFDKKPCRLPLEAGIIKKINLKLLK